MMEKSGLSMSPLSHLVTRLRSAEIVYDPYPHYYLENVFPTEYYQALLRHLPANADYENHPAHVAIYHDDFRHRTQKNMDEGWTKNLPAELREFWDSFNEWFLGLELAQAALESFAAPLSARIGEGTPLPMVTVESQFFRHGAGYSLGPHSEWRTKLVVLVFYLARDESAPHLGTSLYRPKDRDFSCPNSIAYPFDDFVRVKTAPYKPNSLWAFLRSDISFHGVEPVSDQDITALGGRDLISYTIFDKKADEADLRARRLAAEKEATA